MDTSSNNWIMGIIVISRATGTWHLLCTSIPVLNFLISRQHSTMTITHKSFRRISFERKLTPREQPGVKEPFNVKLFADVTTLPAGELWAVSTTNNVGKECLSAYLYTWLIRIKRLVLFWRLGFVYFFPREVFILNMSSDRHVDEPATIIGLKCCVTSRNIMWVLNRKTFLRGRLLQIADDSVYKK